MKNSYLFLAFLPILGSLKAQITITSADFGNVGDQFYVGQDPNPTVMPGNAGPNQTWDFTGLQTQSLDTVYFLDPATVPLASGLTGVNLVTESNEGYFFLERNSNGVFTRALATDFNGAPVLAEYTPAQDLLPFPSSFGDSFGSTAGFSTTVFLGLDTNALGCQVRLDSIRLQRQSVLTTNFDAYGTVQLPTENIQALRANSQDVSTDSLFVYAPNAINCPPFISIPQGWSLMDNFIAQSIGLPGGTYTVTTDIYTWYANNENFGIVAMRMDDQGQVESVLFKSDASQMSLNPQHNTKLQVFPNPIQNNQFNILGATLGDQLELFDLTGRKTIQAVLQGPKVNLDGLAPGIYHVQLFRKGVLVGQDKLVVH